MSEPKPILKSALFDQLPPPWPDGTLREQIARQIVDENRCVVALDDDPTGTQTMHNIWVLTRWEVEDLRTALADGEPSLYILTNSRSVPLSQAQEINRGIAVNLTHAARLTGRPLMIVSRSDSTLRGHYPEEVEALADALSASQGESFDGVCLIPSFPEGGRFTFNDVHWVLEGEELIPAAQTPYAQDAVFGYRHSRLPEWVEEKTGRRVPASRVLSISLDTLRGGGPEAVTRFLQEVEGNRVIIVNAVDYRDLEVFVSGLQKAQAAGKRFLFRTAASFVKVAAGLQDKPLLTADELVAGGPDGGGLIVIGSCVPKSTAQLAAAQALDSVEAVELSVAHLLDQSTREDTISEAAARLNEALTIGRNALVYTSREVVTGDSDEASLSIGKTVSASLMNVVKRINEAPRFVIGKGGITSSDLATQAIGVRAARVMGQLLPGVPVWKLGKNSRWPGMCYVVFPGNVGEDHSLADIITRLYA